MKETGLFAGWIGLLVGIWFLFDKSEKVASPAVKRAITRWLSGLGGEKERWPMTFAHLFDRVFGDRHLSWKCFLRSCVASIAAIVILFFVWFALRPRSITWSIRLFTSEVAIITVYVITVNLIINLVSDYLSLLETRYVIHWMMGYRSATKILGLLVVDLIATLLIACAGIIVGGVIVGYSLIPLTGWPFFWVFHEFYGNLSLMFSLGLKTLRRAVVFETSLATPAAGIWFYSAFFTSVWTWLYVISIGLVRLTRNLGFGVRIRGAFDIEKRPITSLGWVSMVVATALYWSVMLTSVYLHK